MGLEEEFLLVDDEGNLQSAAHDVISEANRRDYKFVDKELFTSMIEIKTNGAEADSTILAQHIVQNRSNLYEIVDELGLKLMACGMHPDASPTRNQLNEEPRYLGFVIEMGLRFQAFTGIHVHIGFNGNLDNLFHSYNAVRWHIPTLIAMSVNSPFSLGESSGYHSKRIHVFSSWKRVGLPPLVRNSDDYVRLLERLNTVGAINSEKDLWFDIRPRLHFNTLEFRCFDSQPNAEFSVDLACFVRALASASMDSSCCFRKALPDQNDLALSSNRYLAYRDGLNAKFHYGNGIRIPAKDIAFKTLQILEPYFDCYGDHDSYERIKSHIHLGDFAERSLNHYVTNRTIPYNMMILGVGGQESLYRERNEYEYI